VAEQGGRIIARAVWWGFQQAEHPLELDSLDALPDVENPAHVAAELVTAALRTWPPGADVPTYHLFVPVSWRTEHEVVAAVSWRLEAAGRAGLSDVVERLRFEWKAGHAMPRRSDRLRFVAGEDEEFVRMFRRVAVGSLDSDTQRRTARLGDQNAAQQILSAYSMMPGGRAGWRLARNSRDELVGFVMPSANDVGPVIAYLGVVPEHRGQGYVDDLLTEATEFLVSEGAARIVADTDAANLPMVAAFERTGYRKFAVRLTATLAA
jgi:RimJ/RimL family protein N-acetyltransferase